MMLGRRCRVAWAAILPSQSSKLVVPTLDNSRPSSRSIRLMCLQGGLALLTTGPVHLATITGPLPIRTRGFARGLVMAHD